MLGWNWCRHEIENYLLDPQLVERALEWNRDEFAQDLVVAAMRIRYYQMARWAVGTARSGLPPGYDLTTRPHEIEQTDIRLPEDISGAACLAWARQHIAQFRERIDLALNPDQVNELIKRYETTLTEELFSSVAQALIWCSGKDLLAALKPELLRRGITDAGAFRARLRDWISENPDSAIECLPEWSSLVAVLRA